MPSTAQRPAQNGLTLPLCWWCLLDSPTVQVRSFSKRFLAVKCTRLGSLRSSTVSYLINLKWHFAADFRFCPISPCTMHPHPLPPFSLPLSPSPAPPLCLPSVHPPLPLPLSLSICAPHTHRHTHACRRAGPRLLSHNVLWRQYVCKPQLGAFASCCRLSPPFASPQVPVHPSGQALRRYY
jgi:hypothetical protein